MEQSKNELKVESPCHMRWSELTGKGSKRWCDECALHVVDGASLTRREANDLVADSADRVCMRIVRGADGEIVHAESPARAGVLGRVLRYGLTAAAGVLAACVDESAESTVETPSGGGVDTPGVDGTPPQGRPIEIMGEVCYTPDEPIAGATEELGDAALPREIMGRVAPQPRTPGEPRVEGHPPEVD